MGQYLLHLVNDRSVRARYVLRSVSQTREVTVTHGQTDMAHLGATPTSAQHPGP
jgi:hypothetical protein